MGNKNENTKKPKPGIAVVNVEPVSTMLDKYYSSYSSYTPEQQINSMIIADSCVKQILENARNGYNEKFMAETKKSPVIKPSDFELLQFVLNYRTNGSGSRVIAADNIQGQRELLLKHSKLIGVIYATKILKEPEKKNGNGKPAQKSDKHRQAGASECILEPFVTPFRQAEIEPVVTPSTPAKVKVTDEPDLYKYATGIDSRLAPKCIAADARVQTTEMKEKEAKVGAAAVTEKSDKLQSGASDSSILQPLLGGGSDPTKSKQLSNPEIAEDGFDLQAALKDIECVRTILKVKEADLKVSAKMCNEVQSFVFKIHQRAVGNADHAKFKEFLNSEFEGDLLLKLKASVNWVWKILKEAEEKAAHKSAILQPSVADNIAKRGVENSAPAQHKELSNSKTDGHVGDQSFSKFMADVDRDWNNIMKEKEAREQPLPLIPPEAIDKAEMQSIPIEDVQKAEKFQSGIVDAILNCVYGDPDSTKHKERSNSESDKKHEAVAAQKPDKPHCETDSLFEYVMGDSDSTKKDSVRPRSEIDDSISKKANEMLAAVVARENKKEKEAREELLPLIPPEDKAENPSMQSISNKASEWEKFSENDSDRPIVNESDDTVHVQAVSNSTPNVDRALKEWKKLKLLAAARKADKLQAIIDEALQCPDSVNMKYKELMNLQTGGAIGDQLASNAAVNSVYNELKEAVQKCDKLQAEIDKYEKLLNSEIGDGIDKKADSNPVAAVAHEMKEKEAKVGAAAAEKSDKLQSDATDSSILQPFLEGLNAKLLNSEINNSGVDAQAIFKIADHVWRNLKEKEASYKNAIQKFDKFQSAVYKIIQRDDEDSGNINYQEISNIDGNVDVQAISSPDASADRVCNEVKDTKAAKKFVKLEALVAKLLKRAGGDDSGHINYKELLNSEIDGDVSGNHLCLNPTAAADHDNSKMNDVINKASQKLDKLQSEIDSLHHSVEKDFAKYDKLPSSESNGDGIDERAASLLAGAVARDNDDKEKEKEKEAREELLPLIPPEEEDENSSMQIDSDMIAEMEKMWDTDFFRTFFIMYRAGFRAAFKELNHRLPEENEFPDRYYISQSVNQYNIQSDEQFIRLAPSLGELMALELAKKKNYSSSDDVYEDARE